MPKEAKSATPTYDKYISKKTGGHVYLTTDDIAVMAKSNMLGSIELVQRDVSVNVTEAKQTIGGGPVE